MKEIEEGLRESIRIKEKILEEGIGQIAAIAEVILRSLKGGGKGILFGNGGSAADAQHIAAELVGRFRKERKAIPAIALSTNTSVVTAIGNDYGFERIFARQMEAMANPADVALGISTSGNADNVIKAIGVAREKGISTIALTGGDGGKLAQLADISFIVPSEETPRIQEAHITIGHLICQIVEEQVDEES